MFTEFPAADQKHLSTVGLVGYVDFISRIWFNTVSRS